VLYNYNRQVLTLTDNGFDFTLLKNNISLDIEANKKTSSHEGTKYRRWYLRF
jgi:hypothetical protein